MLNLNLRTILFNILFLSSLSVHAGLITDTNNDSFIDENTGLEWMDFGINNNQSYNYVTSQLGQGGQYQGWELPSVEQVYTMWTNAFIGLGSKQEQITLHKLKIDDGQGVSGSTLQDNILKMGINKTYRPSTKKESYRSLGWYEGTYGLAYVATTTYTGSTYDIMANDSAKLIDKASYDRYKGTILTQWSTLLVRNNVSASSKRSSVSAPATMTIFALSIMGLALGRNKQG